MKRAILGIGGILGHDANAALLLDGDLIAASQEERFTRLKHDGSFPENAVADCLRIGGTEPGDVSDVVFAEKPLQSRLFDLTGIPGNPLRTFLGETLPESMSPVYVRKARQHLPKAKFHYAWHHLSHVAAAFHSSPFQKAAFLCLDGKGEDYCASLGTIDHGSIEILEEQTYENGLGIFYTLVTHFLGFLSFGSEYKVMGLAPYGKPGRVGQLSELFTTDAAGGFRLKEAVRFQWEDLLKARALVAQATGVAIRKPEDPLQPEHIEIAASLQHIFETEVLKMAKHVRERTGLENLLFCGGCAQNCVTAGRLRREKIFDKVFNSPVGGDMGSGLGAAILLEREQTGGAVLELDFRGYYLGSEPGSAPDEAEAYRVSHGKDLFEHVAGELAAGKIVAWVRGRMELGARALGARSILADPRPPGMQSRLNLAVKFRESFRPFAPLVLAEDCAEWFDTDEPSDFMQYTAFLKPQKRFGRPKEGGTLREQLDFPRCSVASVVHVDFSARIQTVRREVHPEMHQLLSAFKRRAGVPLLINTSFNVSGQPIVRTAVEAWECFVNTDIDLLVLGDAVYRNPFQKTREAKLKWLKQFEKSA